MIIWQYFFKNSGFVSISSVDFFNDFSFRVQYPIHYLHCFVLNLTNQFNIFFISQPLLMRSKLVLSLFSINSRHYFSLMATFVLVKCTPFFIQCIHYTYFILCWQNFIMCLCCYTKWTQIYLKWLNLFLRFFSMSSFMSDSLWMTVYFTVIYYKASS